MGLRTPAGDKHMAWCKQRALELLDAGKTAEALTSMISDLGKHPETECHPGIELGMMMSMAGHLSEREAMRKFIEGFN